MPDSCKTDRYEQSGLTRPEYPAGSMESAAALVAVVSAKPSKVKRACRLAASVSFGTPVCLPV